MRLKFNKEYLKYYTYAILGLITLIVFYKISDNLGFIRSGMIGRFECRAMLTYLSSIVAICFLFRPKRCLEKKVFKQTKDGAKYPKYVGWKSY